MGSQNDHLLEKGLGQVTGQGPRMHGRGSGELGLLVLALSCTPGKMFVRGFCVLTLGGRCCEAPEGMPLLKKTQVLPKKVAICSVSQACWSSHCVPICLLTLNSAFQTFKNS